MKYARVTWNESFQEWAKASEVPCICGKHFDPLAYEGHKVGCPMIEAAEHWRTSGNKLYEELKARYPADMPVFTTN